MALGNCDDNNACTIDRCDPTVGCRHVPNLRCSIVANLAFKLVNPIAALSFKRSGGTKDGGGFVKVTLQDVVIESVDSKLVRQKVKVNAVITGADAGLASLLYPIVALGGGAGALDALHAHGYDVAVTGDLQPCQDAFPSDVCTTLAQQLSKAIDASLGPGDDGERDAFRQGAQALGYSPDGCCTPTTCAAQGANCDSIPDGCGGTLECGSCTLPATCGGAGMPNQCGVIL